VGRVSACQVDARHHTGEGCLRSCLRSRALKEQEVAFEEVECRGVEGRFIGEGNNLNRPQVPTIPAPESVPPVTHHFPLGHHRMYFIPPSSSSMPENGRQACNSHPARGSDRHTQDSMDGRTRHRSHAGR
jgi:hypothetical protein